MIVYNNSDPINGLIQQIHIAYKGNTNFPAANSAQYTEYLTIANRLLDNWAMDANQKWDSLFNDASIGTVANTTTLIFPLPADTIMVSDGVFVAIPGQNGNFVRYQVIHPERRNEGKHNFNNEIDAPKVYIKGTPGRGSNMSLVFTQPFDSILVGGAMTAGLYTMPAQLESPTQLVVINNPQWLIMATAAELARNDPSKQDQVGTLQGMANQAYSLMVTQNQSNSFESPNNPYQYGVGRPSVVPTMQYGSA